MTIFSLNWEVSGTVLCSDLSALILCVCVCVCCAEDDRVYGYARFETGDEMSRRAKFAFFTWIGPAVSPLKKAKVSTDKAFVKKIWDVRCLCIKHPCSKLPNRSLSLLLSNLAKNFSLMRRATSSMIRC